MRSDKNKPSVIVSCKCFSKITQKQKPGHAQFAHFYLLLHPSSALYTVYRLKSAPMQSSTPSRQRYVTSSLVGFHKNRCKHIFRKENAALKCAKIGDFHTEIRVRGATLASVTANQTATDTATLQGGDSLVSFIKTVDRDHGIYHISNLYKPAQAHKNTLKYRKERKVEKKI